MKPSGVIILDKPVEKSSAYIARRVGRMLGADKVGHLGTLDPFATGVLPIAINDATKLIHYINSKQKTYVFEIVFGKKTNTADRTGEIIAESPNIPGESALISAIPSLVGEIFQTPHIFSAIKVDGKRAYDLARSGLIPEIKQRKVTIFSMKYIKQIGSDSFEIEAVVSPGTYIRTLAEDIAKILDTYAYVKTLRRTQDGIFKIENAITIDELEKNGYNTKDILCAPRDVLDDIPVISIAEHKVKDLGNGLPVPLSCACDYKENAIVAVSDEDSGFFAITEIKDGMAFPKRIVVRSF